MNIEDKRNWLRTFFLLRDRVDNLSDAEVDKLYDDMRNNLGQFQREYFRMPRIESADEHSAFNKSAYEREKELLCGLPPIPDKSKSIHFPDIPKVQEILKDMSNICCNCRRKINRTFSDENDAFDSIALRLYLSSRPMPEPQPLTEQQLQKFSEQMKEMSENYGKRPEEEVREMYRHHIQEQLITLNNLHNTGFLPDSDYQQGKDRLKKLADEHNIEDFENLPYQEREDYIEKKNQKLAGFLTDVLNDAGIRLCD